ncbi:hypothetical protein CsSME_00013323 [Camellia sinensis var. sinensis]
MKSNAPWAPLITIEEKPSSELETAPTTLKSVLPSLPPCSFPKISIVMLR